jgi:hypothetical protein
MIKTATTYEKNVAVFRFQGGHTQLQTTISLYISNAKSEPESYDTLYLVPCPFLLT